MNKITVSPHLIQQWSHVMRVEEEGKKVGLHLRVCPLGLGQVVGQSGMLFKWKKPNFKRLKRGELSINESMKRWVFSAHQAEQTKQVLKKKRRLKSNLAGIRPQGDRNGVSDARKWGACRLRSTWKQSGKSQVMAA